MCTASPAGDWPVEGRDVICDWRLGPTTVLQCYLSTNSLRAVVALHACVCVCPRRRGAVAVTGRRGDESRRIQAFSRSSVGSFRFVIIFTGFVRSFLVFIEHDGLGPPGQVRGRRSGLRLAHRF